VDNASANYAQPLIVKTTVFFESPYRLTKTLGACIDIMPDRTFASRANSRKNSRNSAAAQPATFSRITRLIRQKERLFLMIAGRGD